jgi:putative cardiolipin synthase
MATVGPGEGAFVPEELPGDFSNTNKPNKPKPVECMNSMKPTVRPYRSTIIISPMLIILLLCGCASLPTDYPRTKTTAYTDVGDTQLAQALAPALDAHPGQSGFYVLNSGLEALAARILLIDEAQRSIDVQYYFILNDITGNLFIERLVAAADRGVRVRVLIDDLAIEGADPVIAALDSHPNMGVRIFNPFAQRTLRVVDFLGDFARVNRRMHNKSFIVDNQATIVGGRNIGDEYFQARPDLDFGDLDLLGVGPVVADVSAAFDAYWNSELAVPIAALVHPRKDTLELATVRRVLEREAKQVNQSSYAEAVKMTDLITGLEGGVLPLYWGPAQVVYDLPEKVLSPGRDVSTHVGPHLQLILESARSEVVILSPYFVPGDWGVEFFRILRSKHVRVIILTNSLASTDVAAVHAGYAPYRRALLEAGVELYELKPTAPLRPLHERVLRSDVSRSSLHAKAFAVDRKRLFVGSFNLDPRSVVHNTEMGILVENAELAGSFVDTTLAGLPAKAYRLVLAEEASGSRLEWVTREQDREVRYGKEPETDFWRRFSVKLLGLLPIEHLL